MSITFENVLIQNRDYATIEKKVFADIEVYAEKYGEKSVRKNLTRNACRDTVSGIYLLLEGDKLKYKRGKNNMLIYLQMIDEPQDRHKFVL